MVADNIRQKEEVKKKTAKEMVARNVCLRHKRSEAFQRCQDCMDNISSPSEEAILKALVSLSVDTPKDIIIHLGGKLDDHPNQRWRTVAVKIMSRSNV